MTGNTCNNMVQYTIQEINHGIVLQYNLVPWNYYMLLPDDIKSEGVIKTILSGKNTEYKGW